MLQPRKHVGNSAPKNLRVWKALSSPTRGLCEIEEIIEKEEVSIKTMQSLERFMRANPEVWSESSVPHLLAEIGDAEYCSGSGRRAAEERLHTLITRIVVPMAKVVEAEQGSMKVERQKMQEATLALQRVQEECHRALVDLTSQQSTSSRDLEELRKALEENRLAGGEAGRKLAEKEEQINLMVQKQRDLVVRLVCGGPSEFLRWAREEIQSQGLTDLNKELEHSQWCLDNKTSLVPECSKWSTTFSVEEGEDGTCLKPHDCVSAPVNASVRDLSMKLLSLTVSETFRQMEESFDGVRGLLSLPFAVAGFWTGLAGRMACLAMVTLFPEAMQKVATIVQSLPDKV